MHIGNSHKHKKWVIYVMLDSGKGGRGLGLQKQVRQFTVRWKKLTLSTQMFAEPSWNNETQRLMIKWTLISASQSLTPDDSSLLKSKSDYSPHLKIFQFLPRIPRAHSKLLRMNPALQIQTLMLLQYQPPALQSHCTLRPRALSHSHSSLLKSSNHFFQD